MCDEPARAQITQFVSFFSSEKKSLTKLILHASIDLRKPLAIFDLSYLKLKVSKYQMFNETGVYNRPYRTNLGFNKLKLVCCIDFMLQTCIFEEITLVRFALD